MELLKIQSNPTEESKELIRVLEIIQNFNPDIKKYKYLISYFDGIPNDNFEGSFNDFFNKIIDGEKGLLMSYNQLKIKLNGLFQIFDLVLIIDQELVNFNKRDIKDDAFMHKNFLITISYFDGGFWEISSQDQNLLDFIKIKISESYW